MTPVGTGRLVFSHLHLPEPWLGCDCVLGPGCCTSSFRFPSATGDECLSKSLKCLCFGWEVGTGGTLCAPGAPQPDCRPLPTSGVPPDRGCPSAQHLEPPPTSCLSRRRALPDGRSPPADPEPAGGDGEHASVLQHGGCSSAWAQQPPPSSSESPDLISASPTWICSCAEFARIKAKLLALWLSSVLPGPSVHPSASSIPSSPSPLFVHLPGPPRFPLQGFWGAFSYFWARQPVQTAPLLFFFCSSSPSTMSS